MSEPCQCDAGKFCHAQNRHEPGHCPLTLKSGKKQTRCGHCRRYIPRQLLPSPPHLSPPPVSPLGSPPLLVSPPVSPLVSPLQWSPPHRSPSKRDASTEITPGLSRAVVPSWPVGWTEVRREEGDRCCLLHEQSRLRVDVVRDRLEVRPDEGGGASCLVPPSFDFTLSDDSPRVTLDRLSDALAEECAFVDAFSDVDFVLSVAPDRRCYLLTHALCPSLQYDLSFDRRLSLRSLSHVLAVDVPHSCWTKALSGLTRPFPGFGPVSGSVSALQLVHSLSSVAVVMSVSPDGTRCSVNGSSDISLSRRDLQRHMAREHARLTLQWTDADLARGRRLVQASKHIASITGSLTAYSAVASKELPFGCSLRDPSPFLQKLRDLTIHTRDAAESPVEVLRAEHKWRVANCGGATTEALQRVSRQLGISLKKLH